VVDNEAGMEHMSRLVTQDIDHLYVISDPSSRGFLTVKRIIELIGELNLTIKDWHIIVNRVMENEDEIITKMAQEKGLRISGLIREDRILARADAEGMNIFSIPKDSIVISDAYSIFAKTLSKGKR
jgi:CO dehydrogenase maturation factor